MIRSRLLRAGLLLGVGATLLPACTGLVAGPTTQFAATVPVRPDSAWNRLRRGVSAEVMSLQLVDSLQGVLQARRMPKVAAEPEALERCHILLDLKLTPMGDSTGFAWVTQWVAPTQLAARQPPICERERAQLVERLQLTIEPPAP